MIQHACSSGTMKRAGYRLSPCFRRIPAQYRITCAKGVSIPTNVHREGQLCPYRTPPGGRV
eukprot:1657581-Rhodomonas_salina.1